MKKYLITHDTIMHADETGTASLLYLLFSKLGYDIEIIRTRDVEILSQHQNNKDSIIFDVGGGELDHHQNNPEDENLWVDGRPLSSLGLTWRKYKSEIIENLLGGNSQKWEIIDKNFIYYIDFTDNTGKMNSVNYCFNAVRSKYNPVKNPDKTWQKMFKGFKSLWELMFSKVELFTTKQSIEPLNTNTEWKKDLDSESIQNAEKLYFLADSVPLNFITLNLLDDKFKPKLKRLEKAIILLELSASWNRRKAMEVMGESETITVNGKTGKILDLRLGISEYPGVDFIIYPDTIQNPGYYQVKMLNGVKMSRTDIQKEGIVDGVRFTHKGGWFAIIQDISNLKDIL